MDSITSGDEAYIISVNELLDMTLDIPDYQRPYRWNSRNIDELLQDISTAIADAAKPDHAHTYRLGTIILHRNTDAYDIVDGQQRIMSLLLVKKCLDPYFSHPIFEKTFTNTITQASIDRNYHLIRKQCSAQTEDDRKRMLEAFNNILKVVVIVVPTIAQAFQLFDSQNTRGKALDPHDLLKAYHLREMSANPQEREEMERAVERWEETDSAHIKTLFDTYLFPIWHWSRGRKSKPFTANDINIYKGVSLDQVSQYPYAQHINSAMPHFQITETFIAGKHFFAMVDHYLNVFEHITTAIATNPEFADIKASIRNSDDNSVPHLDATTYRSPRLTHVIRLFYGALLHYCDRFHDCDHNAQDIDPAAVRTLFTWAFMLRIDLGSLAFASINKYAIGDNTNARYTNHIAMFSAISDARLHTEISSLPVTLLRDSTVNDDSHWKDLYKTLQRINGALEA